MSLIVDTKQDIYDKPDLSFLKNPLEETYDIESTPDVFTTAFINNHALSFMLLGNEQFNDMTEDRIDEQMCLFLDKPHVQDILNISSYKDMGRHIYIYNENDPESSKQLQKHTQSILTCHSLPHSKQYNENKHDFTEYWGWNSSRYDMLMFVLINLWTQAKRKSGITASDIRFLSNIIIEFRGAPYRFYDYVEQKTMGLIPSNQVKFYVQLAIWSNGHIDWAKLLADTGDGGTDNVIPPGLKREMAKAGLDVIEDENIISDDSIVWSDYDKDHIIEYNFNDVLGNYYFARDEQIYAKLKVRDGIREMYPYTSAKFTKVDRIGKAYSIPERDGTESELASLMVVGPKRIRPKDNDTVSYLYPLPKEQGSDELIPQDLLNYIMEHEEFVHPYIYDFFNHFRGKDTTSSSQDKYVKATQPVNKKGQMNIPYYRDGKPIDSFIRVSTGGAHGSIMAGLSLKSEDEIEKWIKTDKKLTVDEKPTVDVRDILHIDWQSFYPTMGSKLQIYKTPEGVDRYTSVIIYRFGLKDDLKPLETTLHKGKGKLSSKEENEIKQKIGVLKSTEKGYKLILNATTGAGNTHKPSALLPLDNKTLSMRLIGNLLIYTLAQRLAQAGAYIISTNTDGLYICNMTKSDTQAVIDDYVSWYAMDVEPEPMARFINRDVSTRIEFKHNRTDITALSGELKHAGQDEFGVKSFGSNVSYPLVSGNAVVEYMKQDDWLTTPYNKQFIVDYIESELKNKNPKVWYMVHTGTKSRKLLYDGKPQQKVNRMMFTKDGKQIDSYNKGLLKKSDKLTVWQQYNNGVDMLDIKDSQGNIINWEEDVLLASGSEGFKMDFLLKDDSNKETVYKPTNAPTNINTDKNITELVLDGTIKSDTLGYFNPVTSSWLPLKQWSVAKLSGFVTNKATILNLMTELDDFDYESLDLDVYVDWAETILQKWKATADIPEIGLVNCDDTVIKKVRTRKLTKKEQEAREMLDYLYPVKENTDG